MAASKVGSLFSAETEAAFEHIDRHFNSEELYGEKGSLVVQKLAARASHHAMPYGLCLQSALVGGPGFSVCQFQVLGMVPFSVAH